MGNNVFQDIKDNSGSSLTSIDNLLTKNFFEKQCVVGKGGFGRVWKVQSKKFNNQVYALKEMSKARIIARRSVNAILLERNILAKLNHPFIVNMKSAFQDRENVYLVMDYCSGGDLRYHLPYHCYNEEETKFMVSCIILALEYIHQQGYVHRDIKPENLVFDERGYLKLTDFGISRATTVNYQAEQTEPKIGDIVDTSGTPGYMSPEAMCKLPHGPVSDFFALGVIVFEMMFRKRPYSGPNKQQIRDNILARQVQIKVHEIPDSWSIEAADFANKLIRRKPQSRMGFENGISELKSHPWFKDFDWTGLLLRKMKAPWVPPKGDNFKVKATDFQNDDMALMAEAEILVRRDSVQKLFDGYYFEHRMAMPLSFQQEKDKMRQKVCLDQAKEVVRKSRNAIQIRKIVSPKINKVMNIEVKDKNFNQIKPQHQRNGSSESTAISSQNSKNSTVKMPRLMKSQSPTSTKNSNHATIANKKPIY